MNLRQKRFKISLTPSSKWSTAYSGTDDLFRDRDRRSKDQDFSTNLTGIRIMVSQGSLHEEDGIFPDFPFVWESDDAIPRTPDYEEFSSDEGGSNSEDLMYEFSGCPTIRRLQQVAFHYKHRACGLQLDLDRERETTGWLEVQAQEQAERISELSAYTVKLALEREAARKLAGRWKLCTCVLGLLVSVFVFAA